MNKALKKVLTLASCTLISFSAIAQEPVEIRFSWWGGNIRHSRTLEAIRVFEEKNPNIKIRAEYTGWGGYLTRLTSQIAGGTEPDVMQINWNWLDIFSPDGNGFYDLSQLSSIDLDKYEEGSLETTTIDGKVHAIPNSMSGSVLLYNENTWKKANLNYPSNWLELLEAGRVFKHTLGADYYPLHLDTNGIKRLVSAYMIQKYGLSIIDQENKAIAYDDELLTEFFASYKALIDNHVTPSTRDMNAYGSGNAETLKPWTSGRWGGMYSPAPTADELQSFLEGDQKLVVGPMIYREDASESGAYFRPAMPYTVSTSSEHPEEAGLFINFMLHDQAALDILRETRGIPYLKESYERLAESGKIDSELLSYQGFKTLDSYIYKTPISSYIDDQQLIAEFKATFESMDYQNTSPESAAKAFRRRADRILRRAIRS